MELFEKYSIHIRTLIFEYASQLYFSRLDSGHDKTSTKQSVTHRCQILAKAIHEKRAQGCDSMQFQVVLAEYLACLKLKHAC